VYGSTNLVFAFSRSVLSRHLIDVGLEQEIARKGVAGLTRDKNFALPLKIIVQRQAR
jgi:hypothetical protein